MILSYNVFNLWLRCLSVVGWFLMADVFSSITLFVAFQLNPKKVQRSVVLGQVTRLSVRQHLEHDRLEAQVRSCDWL